MALHAFMNVVIGVFHLYLFITLMIRHRGLDLSLNPDFYQTHINNINRLVRGNDVDCHDQNCLRALDGTYVPVNPLAVDRARYRSKKDEIANNVLGVCTRDLKFVYVLAGWKESATDSRILGNAMERSHGLRVPRAIATPEVEVVDVEGPLKQKCRSWRKSEEDALMKCMLNEAGDKWKAENGFKKCYFTHLDKELQKVLPGCNLKANPHIDSKVRHWKSVWARFVDITGLSGFGWDVVNKRIDVE
ncbi:hypothetical protein RHMOL_Rhmol11G0093600 [Rhododendron molle]|uniref:Uncharacterized protein n=1 Tax=Rhododendron molle TaxID=49168 RepID=A0ACC0LR98_RHOML|nr:hypothetical protein RHMOL_Rhmol11G0093600 [Rhododendron molle]